MLWMFGNYFVDLHGWLVFFGTLMVVPYHQITWATQSMIWVLADTTKMSPTFFGQTGSSSPKSRLNVCFKNGLLKMQQFVQRRHRAVLLKNPKLWFRSPLASVEAINGCIIIQGPGCYQHFDAHMKTKEAQTISSIFIYPVLGLEKKNTVLTGDIYHIRTGHLDGSSHQLVI